MSVLTAPSAPLSPAVPQSAGPACTLQRSGSLWQLGIEAQELTTTIGQLAEQLEADDDTRAQALADLAAFSAGQSVSSSASQTATAAAGGSRSPSATTWITPAGAPTPSAPAWSTSGPISDEEVPF